MWFGGSNYGHPALTCEYVQRFQDTLDFDVFCSKIFLLIDITDFTLPADSLFINTCRSSLAPSGQSLGHVSDVLISIQNKSNVSQGALSGLVIPEFGIHQNAIMVKEDISLHFFARFNFGLTIKPT